MHTQRRHGLRATGLKLSLLALISGLGLTACSSTDDYGSGRGLKRQTYTNCRDYLRQFDIEFSAVADQTNGACNVRNGVKVTRFGQAKLSRPAVMTCDLAARVSEFEAVFLQPAAKRILGSPITTIHHYGTYSCRRARGKSRLSQHAYANAIDIGILETRSGIRASVSRDWDRSTNKGQFLKSIGQGACTLFHGVLGPDSDRNHRDHFHFDLGPYTYCQQKPEDPSS